MKKALVLLSGGLDSLLAYKIIENEGIDVLGLHYINPIATRHPEQAEEIFQKNNLKYIQISNFIDFLEILKTPKFGFGKNLNPCIDCRLLNIRLAVEEMNDRHFDFLVTGEVQGQRPKSQLRNALDIIESASGIKGLLLRPLSAKILPPTVPELKGWVNRENLYGIQGRSRAIQMEITKKFNITEYASPGGGCPLTAKEYSKKMKDLLDYDLLTADQVGLLNIGRHFRLNDNIKFIIGRNNEDNLKLLKISETFNCIIIDEKTVSGPVSVLLGNPDDNDLRLPMRVVASYTKVSGEIIMKWRNSSDNIWKDIIVVPFARNEIEKFRI
ncbi:hypothetical protein KAU33_05120 [Candidatus Dependentiae bacterium]|nr:hypothetical protein [Candidatus Dependentiae bacterium]